MPITTRSGQERYLPIRFALRPTSRPQRAQITSNWQGYTMTLVPTKPRLRRKMQLLGRVLTVSPWSYSGTTAKTPHSSANTTSTTTKARRRYSDSRTATRAGRSRTTPATAYCGSPQISTVWLTTRPHGSMTSRVVTRTATRTRRTSEHYPSGWYLPTRARRPETHSRRTTLT